MRRKLNSIVFAPPWQSGGVKSLYTACEALAELGESSIVPFQGSGLAEWFDHRCKLYDDSYAPDIVLYPEVYQPRLENHQHVCYVLGKHAPIKPHADLIICRSEELLTWVSAQEPSIPAFTITPGINRCPFEYDGRPKEQLIGYMTRPTKYPEFAEVLRARYKDKVLEIVNCTESEVADHLKRAKVFVWRGDDKEGSPRPPKEALVAGCVVVGLKDDLSAAYHTEFGLRCETADEIVARCEEALASPIPSERERSLVADSSEEKSEWSSLLAYFDS
jgi:hypothetical protein